MTKQIRALNPLQTIVFSVQDFILQRVGLE